METLSEETIELRVPSKPEYVAIVRALVSDIARRMALSSSEVEDVQVAVSEACANVVRHAYLSSGDESREILVRCRATNGSLMMEVVDSGDGFVESEYSFEYLNRNGGFGLLLMKNLMDDISLDSSPEQGTIVRMVKRNPRRRARKIMHGIKVHEYL